jgi:Cysteine rich repeat
MPRASKVCIIAAILALVIQVPAFAQGPRLAACKADVDRFCASEPRGQGRIRACLEANKDKLTPECKIALESTRR